MGVHDVECGQTQGGVANMIKIIILKLLNFYTTFNLV